MLLPALSGNMTDMGDHREVTLPTKQISWWCHVFYNKKKTLFTGEKLFYQGIKNCNKKTT